MSKKFNEYLQKENEIISLLNKGFNKETVIKELNLSFSKSSLDKYLKKGKDSYKYIEARKKFNTWSNSLEVKEIKSKLYRKQLYLCPNCKKPFPINKLDLSHIYSLKYCIDNKKEELICNESNLILLCHSCNASYGTETMTSFI